MELATGQKKKRENKGKRKLKRNVADAAVDCGQQNKVDEIAFGTERAFTG